MKSAIKDGLWTMGYLVVSTAISAGVTWIVNDQLNKRFSKVEKTSETIRNEKVTEAIIEIMEEENEKN